MTHESTTPPCFTEKDPLNEWLSKIDPFSENYEIALRTGDDPLEAKTALETAARCSANVQLRSLLQNAEYYHVSTIHPEPPTLRPSSSFAVPITSSRKGIAYWSNRQNALLLDEAQLHAEMALKDPNRNSAQYARALAYAVYTHAEQLIFRIWRSNALHAQHDSHVTRDDYEFAADFARNAFSEISSDHFPQETALIAYNLARIQDLAGGEELKEAFEYYLLAIHLFHETVEDGARVFNAPPFISHQREFWRCVINAIRLAVVAVGRKDVAVCLSQIVKYPRSPLSVLKNPFEYLPDQALFPTASRRGGISRRGTQMRSYPLHHLPQTVVALGGCLQPQSAILDLYRSDDGLLMTLIGEEGVQSQEAYIEKFYGTHTGVPFRLIENANIDFSLQEGQACWTLRYPRLRVSPQCKEQWMVSPEEASIVVPFTIGVDALCELYKIFFEKLDAYLQSRGIKHLVICTDGALALVPFAALVDNAGRYLVDRYTFSYAPNLSTLLWCLSSSGKSVRSAWLVKDLSGDLPLAGDEIAAVRKSLAPAETFLVS
jgi:hypothetical protein